MDKGGQVDTLISGRLVERPLFGADVYEFAGLLQVHP